MTTFPLAAISDSVIAFQKGITLQQGRAFRDLTLSIAEADTSVTPSLLPTVLLGTLTTTSLSTQTLSGQDLTKFRSLRFTVNGVSSTAATTLLLGPLQVADALASSAHSWSGMIFVDLLNGVTLGIIQLSAGGGTFRVGASGYSQATTSISFSVGSGTFDAGSILVYGEK